MFENLNINVPLEVKLIIKTLNDDNYTACIVGGSVRDSILGIKPKDWDIATNAKPVKIKSLFDKTIDTGIKHGTVTVIINNQNFEITTFRIDGEYLNNRKPESVTFTSSIEDDLSRRDFTFNSIAFHPQMGYIDPFFGINDIKDKIIRTVGNPNQRFEEDALRMLRAVRFAATLNFDIDIKTLESIKENAHLIKNISMERIRDELTKIVMSDNPLKLCLLKETNILKYVLPEFEACFNTAQNNPYHIYDVGMHSLYAVSFIEKKFTLRWTMLLHDIGKPITKTTDEKGIDHFYKHPLKSKYLSEKIMIKLKFDNNTINLILRLIEHHDRKVIPEPYSVRKAISAVGDDIFLDFLKIKEADKKAQNPKMTQEEFKALEEIKEIYFKIKDSNECVNLKSLDINGTDLINLGFKPGKEIGIVLNSLLKIVIKNPKLNIKEHLIKSAKEFFKRGKP